MRRSQGVDHRHSIFVSYTQRQRLATEIFRHFDKYIRLFELLSDGATFPFFAVTLFPLSKMKARSASIYDSDCYDGLMVEDC